MNALENWNQLHRKVGHPNLIGEFVSKHGREFTGTKNQLGTMPDRWCYRNSVLYAIDNGLRYVEGYAHKPTLLQGFMFEHAWCADDEGSLIDPTWNDEYEAEYFGVAFDANLVADLMIKKGTGALYFDKRGRIDKKFLDSGYRNVLAIADATGVT